MLGKVDNSSPTILGLDNVITVNLLELTADNGDYWQQFKALSPNSLAFSVNIACEWNCYHKIDEELPKLPQKAF